MLSSIGRTAVRRIRAVPSTARVGEWTWQVRRVCVTLSSYEHSKMDTGPRTQFARSFGRSYVTATSKPTTKKATTTRKPPTTRRSSRGSGKKTPAKSKKTKKKVTTKPKTRAKKVLTEAQVTKKAEVKAKTEIKDLKAAALLFAPKELPSSAWLVVLAEQMKEKAANKEFVFTKSAADASARYKNLTPTEREHYNHVANQNKLANEEAFKGWVQSHTPDQIRAANLARLNLKRRLGKSGSSRYASIEDPRIPKRSRSANSLFVQERWASGDMRGISAKDGLKTLQEEWSTLPATEKKHFEDLATADRARYVQDYKAVFNEVPAKERKGAVSP